MKDQCYEFIKNQVGKVELVGFGSYGQVKLAKNVETGETVAIKMIYKNAKEEIDVHHKLNHPSIIKLINYYYQKQKNTTYMILEYASGGTLNEKIKFSFGNLNKISVLKYFKDICEAIKYLHQRNYMHRDIKPENILITEDNHAKLCDFGFASILEYRSTLCGTFEYMAPEMIAKKPYDYRVDIWALGILLFELIQGNAPFRGESGQEVMAEMKKPLLFSNRFNNQQVDLIKKILRVNAQNRLEMDAILEHPCLKELQEKKNLAQSFGKKDEKRFQFLSLKFKNKGKQSTTVQEGAKEGVEKQQKKQEKIEEKKDEKKEEKKEEKKQFKHFMPSNITNFKNLIKTPSKPQTATSSTNSSNQNFQVNSSHQVPPSFTQNPSTYHPVNPNVTVNNTNFSKINSTNPHVTPPVSRPFPVNGQFMNAPVNQVPQNSQFQQFKNWKKN